MRGSKAEIRKEIRAKRAGLTAAAVKNLSRKIVNRLVDYTDWKSLKNLHTYLTIASFKEVDTKPLIEFVQSNHPKIKIYTPVSKDESRHYLISAKGKQIVPSPDEVALFIVPLVAFDTRGYRVGNGGGYYDRFLKLYPNSQKIGLAFELQKVDKIPAEPHDVSLDVVITEARIYEFNR